MNERYDVTERNPYAPQRWLADVSLIGHLQWQANNAVYIDKEPDRVITVTADELARLPLEKDRYLAGQVTTLAQQWLGDDGDAAIPAHVLRDKVLLYKAIGRERRALTLLAFHTASTPLDDHARKFHDDCLGRQNAAALVLPQVIALGHGHGLPSLQWVLGSSADIVGNVAVGSLGKPRTGRDPHELALLAYHSWRELLNAQPEGEATGRGLWSIARGYSRGVNVAVSIDFLKMPNDGEAGA